jgi:hypothetical protein
MIDRKVVPFDEFYYQLKLTHVFQKHPGILPFFFVFLFLLILIKIICIYVY